MDAKKVKSILLLLDSEQAGEQSAAFDKLRAQKAQGQAVFRDLFDMFEKVAETADERDKLKQENVKLAARLKAGRPSFWRVIKSHARTAAISSGLVGVIAGGLHLADIQQRGALIAGAKVTASGQCNFERDEALRELRACNQRQSRPSPPSRPAKDRRHEQPQ